MFWFIATAYISAPGDAELMRKMKETIDNQRDTIRSKNMEIDSLRNDLQAVCIVPLMNCVRDSRDLSTNLSCFHERGLLRLLLTEVL